MQDSSTVCLSWGLLHVKPCSWQRGRLAQAGSSCEASCLQQCHSHDFEQGVSR